MQQPKLTRWEYLGGFAFLFLIVYAVAFSNIDGVTWDATAGDGARVSVFQDSSAAKNYRLDADVNAKQAATWYLGKKITYTIKRAEWPDGGFLDFTGCIVTNKLLQTVCKDQNGKMWEVELTQPPTAPDLSSSD